MSYKTSAFSNRINARLVVVIAALVVVISAFASFGERLSGTLGFDSSTPSKVAVANDTREIGGGFSQGLNSTANGSWTPPEIVVTSDSRYEPSEFAELIVVLEPWRSNSSDSVRLDLIRPSDGTTAVRIEVFEGSLRVLKRITANQLLVSGAGWNAVESRQEPYLLVLDATDAFRIVANVDLPDRQGSTAFTTSGLALSASEKYLYYAMQSRRDVPECKVAGNGGDPFGPGSPYACDLKAVGILDLEALSGGLNITRFDLPQGCGTPVVALSGDDNAAVTCRRLQIIYLLDPTGSAISTADMGVLERPNEGVRDAGPSNAFGFQRGDGSLAVMSWGGVVTSLDSAGQAVETELLPEDADLARLFPPYQLENGQILVGISTFPTEVDVTGLVVFDPERLEVTQRIDFGPARAFSPLSTKDLTAAVLREDGSIEIVSPSGALKDLIVTNLKDPVLIR